MPHICRENTLKKLIVTILLCFYFLNLSGNEDIEILLKKHPTLLSAFADVNTQKIDRKITWSRTDMLATFLNHHLEVADNQLFLNKTVVPFLTPELSKQKYEDFQNRRHKLPLVIYKWEFEVEAADNYFLIIPIDAGSLGYLNKQPIILLNDGIVSKKDSGNLKVELIKGKNTLYITCGHSSSSNLAILSGDQSETIRKEIIKKFNNAKDDYAWVTTQFLPTISKVKNLSFKNFNNLLTRLHQLRPFEKTPEACYLLTSFITRNNFENYQIEKFIFQNFPDQYFGLSNKPSGNSFIYFNNVARTFFLQQLIYDGQKSLANSYFDKCIEFINANSFLEKDKMTAAFYAERFLSYFRIGRIKDANEIFKTTNEVCKRVVLDRYTDRRPEQEDQITLTQSFDETSAFQIIELIQGYEGSPDQLGAIYKSFLNANKNLVKRNDGAVSLFYLFQMYKNENEKLKKDFQKLIEEKIQTKLEKAKETRDIDLCEELLSQNEVIVPLPEIRIILLEEYFKNGFFLKALSQAQYIFNKYPQYHEKIVSKLVILENLSELSNENKKNIPPNLLKQPLKISNQATTVDQLSRKPSEPVSIGKFVGSVYLPPSHVQYWNHPQFNYYQPIEPIFTKNNLIFNGGSYLISYSTGTNSIEWDYFSEAEYKDINENGPHQKRFITTHSGNQLFMLTNRNYSSEKTVKCFDLRGNIIWDMSDQKSSLVEEPFCSPIESQGKLFCFNYSNRETINVVNFAMYNASTGSLMSKIPVSLIPGSARDEICRPIGGKWNTFTHDEHFCQDGDFVYAYTGTGVLLKADSNTGNILWEKGHQKTSTSNEYSYRNDIANAASGYIHIYDQNLVYFTPDIQMLSAVNKITGEILWRSKFYSPNFIHNRKKSNNLIFSTESLRSDPKITNVDPKNGEIIWEVSTNGLPITGEGDLLGNKLYIPSDKSLLVYDITNGNLLERITLPFQPLKFRCNSEYSVILSSKNAYILQNKGVFDSKQLLETKLAQTKPKFVLPDTKPSELLGFENINLEVTLKLPEAFYASGDPWKQTNIIKTSKNFHFLLSCKDHLALFREGFHQKDGKYIPPEVLWYQQYPEYAIFEDTLYISEHGKISALNLFTRELNWIYEYNRSNPVFKDDLNKTTPVIAVSKQHIAYQTENQSIMILDRSTRNKVFELYSPSIIELYLEDNYIVTMSQKRQARCYDISSNGKELWMQDYNHNHDAGIENGKFVFVRNNASTITFYDLKTGAVAVNAKDPNGYNYTMNNWVLDETYLFAYKKLFNPKTGEPIAKYNEAAKVTGGGHVGFYKQFGTEGDYILEGKTYAFKMQSQRDYDNKIFAAARKSNRITFFSSWAIETFELSEGKLISIDFIKFYAGPYGNHEAGMSFLPLDDSFLMLRKDEMYFFKNFDLNLEYQKIKSNRVDNKKQFNWPFSEIYPEVILDEKNWISYNGEKPKRSLSYQAFSDEKFAYLKFKLSPRKDRNTNSTLFISGNSFSQTFAITWDADNWKNCQYTFNINEVIDSWKEVDIQGNTILYIKLKIATPISSDFKNTLLDFNIELRQSTSGQNEGMFRIGGAYSKNRKFFPWLTYMNDEGQTLKDFAIRTSLYENNSNFYPQGEDLVIWLKDRRRFKSFEDNIALLKKMLVANAKSYCSVNIISALLNEEIQLLKSKQSDLNEVTDDFTPKIIDIIKKLKQLSQDAGVDNQWSDFALSFWAIEIFPKKINYNFSRNDFFKAVHGLEIRQEKGEYIKKSFYEKDNLLTPNINQPYIEWFIPGLAANFPTNQTLNTLSLVGIETTKTMFGKGTLFTPAGANVFFDRKGKLAKISSVENKAVLTTQETTYDFNKKRYECFSLNSTTRSYIGISIDVPGIKTPNILSTTGQTPESIMVMLENLPSDNNNGLTLIDYYISLKGKVDDEERIKIYSKWLFSIRDNSASINSALNSIFRKNEKQKNIFEFMGSILKEAKIPAYVSRRYFLQRVNNVFLEPNSRSVLGPITQEANPKPEINFDFNASYTAGDKTYKFTNSLDSKMGGTIYIASKITVETNEKPYLFLWATNQNARDCTNSIVSIWLNGKLLVDKITYKNFEENTIYQRLSLIKGENVVLIKIIGVQDNEWGRNYSLGLGDIFGMPIPGVGMKSFTK